MEGNSNSRNREVSYAEGIGYPEANLLCANRYMNGLTDGRVRKHKIGPVLWDIVNLAAKMTKYE